MDNLQALTYFLAAIGGSLVQPLLKYLLALRKLPTENAQGAAAAELTDAQADSLAVATAHNYDALESKHLARHNTLMAELLQRDANVLALNTQVTELQIQVNRNERHLAQLQTELESRDRTIETLRVELEAERSLRKKVQRRLAEIDPDFSLDELETQV